MLVFVTFNLTYLTDEKREEKFNLTYFTEEKRGKV